MVFILMAMAEWYTKVVDVHGSFLYGEFDEGMQFYMELPEGFQNFYPISCLLLFLQAIYSLKQAAFTFWVQLLRVLRDMKFNCSKANPIYISSRQRLG